LHGRHVSADGQAGALSAEAHGWRQEQQGHCASSCAPVSHARISAKSAIGLPAPTCAPHTNPRAERANSTQSTSDEPRPSAHLPPTLNVTQSRMRLADETKAPARDSPPHSGHRLLGSVSPHRRHDLPGRR
jgi:hypothetical protein